MAYCVPADFSIIEIWFAIVSVLGAWCNSTIFVCYYTALTALFPYKEQRSQVHGSTMLIALPGVFVGVFIYSMSLSDASTSSRFGYAIVSCIFIALGGALSLPVYMRIPEKRKDDTLEKSSTWELIKEIFGTDASRIIVLKNLFDGGTGGAVAIFSYYLSYVAKVTLDERSVYVVVILIGALFVFALIAYTMKKLFDLKDKEIMLTRYRTFLCSIVLSTTTQRNTTNTQPNRYVTNDRNGCDTVSCDRICDRTEHLNKWNRICDLDCD